MQGGVRKIIKFWAQNLKLLKIYQILWRFMLQKAWGLNIGEDSTETLVEFKDSD